MAMAPQPTKNLDSLAEADMKNNLSVKSISTQNSSGSSSPLNPYGNDTDAVDVATRVAMVRLDFV